MWKKTFRLLSWIVIIVALAACGGNGQQEPNSKNNSASADQSGSASREIVIWGSNFKFDQEEYVVSVGETVKLTYRNEQGNHGIYIEGVKVRLRHNEQTEITFTEPGAYEIICNIYCGAGHAGMKAKLIVQ